MTVKIRCSGKEAGRKRPYVTDLFTRNTQKRQSCRDGKYICGCLGWGQEIMVNTQEGAYGEDALV